MGFEAFKRRLAYCVTVGISLYTKLHHKVLVYKSDLSNFYVLLCVP